MKKDYCFKWILRGLTGLFFGFLSGSLYAQTPYAIEGRVTDQNDEPVSYANIVIRALSDSSLVGGTISAEDGTFSFLHNKPGTFLVTARFVGYTPGHVTVEAPEEMTEDTSRESMLYAGTMVLEQERTAIDEAVIKKNRIKAKQQAERTTYYVNSSMRSASQTGIHLIKMIPGVQVDLFNKVSLDGSKAIVILVNGMKRDSDYLGQLDADQIDRVEILPTSGMQYGAQVSGVINVILKEMKRNGISGHLYANVPVKSDEVFSFPTASLTYTRKKTTWYTSYNGGFSYFNIEGKNRKTISAGKQPLEILRTAKLDQENWSHKVHFGMDRFSNGKNQFSLYGFVSGFSNEQDGFIEITRTDDGSGPSVNAFMRDETDHNRSAYSSSYFRHRFLSGSALILEGSYYRLRSKTGTRLTGRDNLGLMESGAKPVKDEVNFRALFTSNIGEHLRMEAGLQHRYTSMQDNQLTSFRYKDQIFAGYLQGVFSGQRAEASGALRVEHSKLIYSDVLDETGILLLPRVELNYLIKPGSNVNISYRKRVNRPTIYQLNPNPFAPDPYTLQRGNPGLLPEVIHHFSAMYSLTFRENYFSAGLFYRKEKRIIEDLNRLDGTVMFLEEKQNLGDRAHAGVKALGSMNLFKQFSLNPHIEFSRVQTRGNSLARSQDISDRAGLEIRGKLSAVWTIADVMSLSASMQFQTASMGIQRNQHEGVLYFLHVDKVFFDRLKFGITSAIPFMRSFKYQGFDISSGKFTVTSEDHIRMSMFPVWFKLKYSFASGPLTRRLDRDEVFEEKREKKGF